MVAKSRSLFYNYNEQHVLQIREPKSQYETGHNKYHNNNDPKYFDVAPSKKLKQQCTHFVALSYRSDKSRDLTGRKQLYFV